MADAINPLRFDTALLPPPARFEAWRSALANLDVSRRETEPFAAQATVWLLGSLVLTRADVDPVRYARTEARIRADLHDHLAFVQLIRGGFVGDFGHGEVRSDPGSLTVLDMRRACWTDAERLDAFILSIPRAFLMPVLGDLDPHGMVVASGMAALLGATLAGICDTLPALAREDAPVVARTIRDLVAETLLAAQRSRGLPPRRREEALISRVRDYIDAHLTAPLDVAALCQALGTSRSTLYRAFGGSGGVQQQVQRRRLNALRIRLDDPAEARSIADLAAQLGFADKSHATRLFKREYGFTPGDYRVRGADGLLIPEAVEDVPHVFERWTTLLD